MGRRSGRKCAAICCFSRRFRTLPLASPWSPITTSTSPRTHANNPSQEPAGGSISVAAKAGHRIWMRVDRAGNSEAVELDKSAILTRFSIPARDLRLLGPAFSNSSHILGREQAIVINLQHIKAVLTADEVLLLDPLSQEVLPFADQLIHQFTSEGGKGNELPFEFQVLEMALQSVCACLHSNASDLERSSYPVLDALALHVSTKNLERVRSLKCNLTRLLARVQKVRDEIEHLLDDDVDMAQLYLTRKKIQHQELEALITSGASDIVARVNSNRSGSIVTNIHSDDHNDVEDLEMLLEAYFVQLDGTRNKILSVREHIDDTEDYVNIQLDNHRNELIQLQLILTITSFSISMNTLIVGIFSMNLPCHLYSVQNLFGPFVGGMSGTCFSVFLLVLGYARWKKLLGP